MNQKRMLRDFLAMQVTEKRERQNEERIQKVKELDVMRKYINLYRL